MSINAENLTIKSLEESRLFVCALGEEGFISEYTRIFVKQGKEGLLCVRETEKQTNIRTREIVKLAQNVLKVVRERKVGHILRKRGASCFI